LIDHSARPAAYQAVVSLHILAVERRVTKAATSWQSRLANHRLQSNFRGILEILWTAIPFAALWIAAWSVFQVSPWLSILLGVPAAGFLVRLFLIQHDCGHGSLFTSRRANDWVGRVIGVITLTPYGYWRTAHAHHHAGSGNLERRGIGDIDTLTVAEYAALKPFGRLRYRLYRHPLVIFGLGPAYLFLLRHRLPLGWKGGDRTYWSSVMGTNFVIVLLVGLLVALIGWRQVLATHLPIAVVASSIGVWLFYVQHQFEETFWAHTPGWTPQKAALVGSSHYALPRPLAWLTANIGLHHLHHLSSRIPFYRLPKALADCPELAGTTRLTLRSIKCAGLALWDEQSNRLVSFAEARRILAR
jgi:acyl-lipid omega-6 desaturase (Delta-12 desaturase)